MLATILFAIPIGLLPIGPLPQPTRDCLLEVLTPAALEDRAVVDFQMRIDAYVALHRRLARSTGAMPDDEGAFFGGEMRAALVAARPQARQGGFFTPGVETVFRKRIDRSLLLGLPVSGGRLYEPLLGEPAPAVNAAFPAVPGAVTWPGLFLELPELPPELGYALWGRDLVLVDVVANLVLDVMPEALPEGAYRGVLYQ
jgi:hypothetical protein